MSQIQEKLMKQNKLHYDDVIQNANRIPNKNINSDSYNTSRPWMSNQMFQKYKKDNKMITSSWKSNENWQSKHIRNNSENVKNTSKISRNNDSKYSEISKSEWRITPSYQSIYERQKQWAEKVKKKKEDALNEK